MFFLILVLVLLSAGLMTFIAAENLVRLVPLKVFTWDTPDLPLGVWLVVAFLCGAVVLYVVSLLSALSDRRRMKALQKRVLALEAQITTMSQTSSSSSEQMPVDRLSSANTGPMLALPDVMNTPPPEGRVPSSPLSALRLRHFR